jgi:uncharacterized protein
VSADRLPIAVSQRLDPAMADQLAAIASGVASLSQGAARYFDAGLVKQTVLEMQRGFCEVVAGPRAAQRRWRPRARSATSVAGWSR